MTGTTSLAVRTFILENFLFGDEAALPADNQSLIAGGIIDSTGVLELVAFIEDGFGVRVDDADITPTNLDSVDAIVSFLQRKAQLAA
ncbi:MULTISPECIES: acyl carrier protein [Agrobacterium]|uniref:Acyl carrier protein n=1 Tax=Agrobacterium tumefaciens TaxID=358 RepID=A0A176X1F3_AGRTU|nr:MULTISPECIES: acyl carrier protein [Agrobacterium]OAE40494.1 acyl carrier protein [Agrobacterium tumefaciens]